MGSLERLVELHQTNRLFALVFLRDGCFGVSLINELSRDRNLDM